MLLVLPRRPVRDGGDLLGGNGGENVIGRIQKRPLFQAVDGLAALYFVGAPGFTVGTQTQFFRVARSRVRPSLLVAR